MAIATTTRTHLIYQFIILTLLFLSIGYNELLPDRKFILFLAFIPIFCYQLVIISCCPELIRLPQCLRFLLDNSNKKRNSRTSEESSRGSRKSSLTSTTLVSSGVQTNSKLTFPDISEIPCHRQWEKSVTNLGEASKYLTQQQKAKSWMSLNDSKSSEKLLSREGSVDVLSPLIGRKSSWRVDKAVKARNREERAKKARSWKPCDTFDASLNGLTLSMDSTQPSVSNYVETPKEETELSKSYSFPFRQKKLETWSERKETTMGQSNDSLNMPYWQSVGYNLAVKYEARRRRRAISHATNSGIPEEASCVMQKSQEVVYDSAHKQNSKKSAKSASACINKIKVGFSNLMSKKKDDILENITPNKAAKSNLLQKFKTKNTCPMKEIEKHEASMPEFPQFLNNDRPLLFYPKYLPFEKERFETDVRKKMKELAEEVKANCST